MEKKIRSGKSIDEKNIQILEKKNVGNGDSLKKTQRKRKQRSEKRIVEKRYWKRKQSKKKIEMVQKTQ